MRASSQIVFNTQNRNVEAIKVLESMFVNSLDGFEKEETFYKLPMVNILSIIRKKKFDDVEQLCELISRMNENKREESVLLLNVIDLKNATFEECIKVIAKFVNSPICKRTGELFDEYKNLPERDNDDEIVEIRKDTRKRQNTSAFPPVTKKPSDFENDIFMAATEGKLTSVKYHVEKRHADVETRNENGYTPLNLASTNGHLDVVKYLYEKCHANIESKDNYGSTPIANASIFSHLDVVEYLFETCHANIDTKDNTGLTPISTASSNNELEVVKYLYENCHANVEANDNYGNTPINNASLNGQLKIVKYLYETCHANVESRDILGNTPIINASRNGHLEVVKYLYETCHAKVTDRTINEAKQKCKEYLLSKQQ